MDELTIFVKTSGDKKYELQVSAGATVSELKEKVAKECGVAADQQRLIYSGRILKDHDELSKYNIKSGNAVHLVKSATKRSDDSSSAAASSSAPSAAAASVGAGVPPALAAGQVAGNPLSDLTGARYSGLASLPSASLFGPDGGQGAMPSMSDMNALMAENPEMLDSALNMLMESDANNTLLASMPPAAREQVKQVMKSPEVRAMMADPERMRRFMQASMQMQTLMERMPSIPGMPTMPGAASGEGGAGSSGRAPNAGSSSGLGQMPDPASLTQMLQSLNELNSAMGDMPVNPAAAAEYPLLRQQLSQGMLPDDPRPPEERFETQLMQLNELGFFDFDRNIRALRRSGGNVEGAVEALLDGHV